MANLLGTVPDISEIYGHLENATLQGMSAYEVAVKNGYTGTEAEWLASLKGETGETPNIQVGNVSTGQPGTNASATMTGTKENPVLNMTIPRGDVGATPNMIIGTVVTGEEGAQAQASITGTPENPVLNLTIPKGDTGDDGFNPVVEVTKDGNTATVSVTDATHTTEVNIVDGYTPQKNVDYFDGHSPKITGAKSQGTTFIYSDGEQIGAIADGEDGYTPRKGVDYFDGHTPAISGEKIDDTTFIYADGVRIATVLDGLDGNSPVITTVKYGKTTSILADSVVIGTVSDGADGHSPTITTTKSGKTTTILSDGTSIGTVSDGQDGHSPEITTNKVGKVLTILSDGQTIGTVSDGADGIAPTITTNKSGTTTTIYSNGVAIGTVEDGADGSTPVITATKSEGITTIKANGIDIATINDGVAGDDGYSPTASVTKSGGISTLTVTDENGTTTTQILDGTGMIASDPNNDGNIVLSSVVGVQIDEEPTSGSTNAISSGSVYNELTDVRSDLQQKYEKPSAGIPASDLASGVIPDVSGKADKVQSATSGNFASLDANGNVTDSGHKHSDYLTEAPVTDVQVNGTSVLNQGVANIPLMGYNTIGMARAESNYGITIIGTTLALSKAADSVVKQGAYEYKAIVPSSQHLATFYGLCKAAGVDMASSSNAVGVYTDEAKVAIQKMLGIYEAPWELIREDTFTNAEIADHIISVDGDGNNFWLTDMALMFETPTQETASEKGTSGLIRITIDSSEILAEVGAWTQEANAAPHGAFVFVEQRKGFVTTHYSTAVGYATSRASDNYRYLGFGSASSRCQNGVFLASSECYITSINIKSVLGTGHYILYGKRKWS